MTPIASVIAGDAPKMLALLAGAAAIAMIVALTNLAGLLLVRAIDRRRELAVRTALGAGRGSIVRQLLLEAQAIVILGAAGGALLALWLTPVVAGLALQQFGGPGQAGIAVNWRGIMLISLAACVFAALCVLLPSVAGAPSGIVDVLRRGVTAPPRDRRLRRVFVTAQIALAFVLLVSVTFLARGWMTLLRYTGRFRRERRHGAGRVAAGGALCHRRPGRHLLRDAPELAAAAFRRPCRGDHRRAADDR